MHQRRAVAALFALSLLGMGCPKDKGDVTNPTDGKGKPAAAAKKVAPEILADLDKATELCKRAYDAADAEKIQPSEPAYDADAVQKDADECKASLERALSKDASLAAYKGEIDERPYDVPALKKQADEIPGRLLIAKDTYDKAVQAKKDAEKAEWEPLLKGDRLKIFQEKGVPSSTDAADIGTPAAAVAKTWVYQSAPRDDNGKKVVDVTIYTFKKDKLSGKPKVEVQDYP
jgi:hypothetical protein